MIKCIIEGPDGSGKSTLSEYLAFQLGCEIFHSPLPKSAEDIFEIDKTILKLIDDPKMYIVDRVPSISDPAYREAFNKPLRVSNTYLNEQLSQYKSIPIIFCQQPDDYVAAMKPYKDDAYHQMVKTAAEQLRCNYHLIFEKLITLSYSVIIYDYVLDEMDDVLINL